MGDPDWRAVRELMALGARLRETAERALSPPSSVVLANPVAFEPLVDVWESEDEVIVEAELPGARSGDIDVRLEGDTLILSGELVEDSDLSTRYLRIERPRGRFHRAVALPTAVTCKTTATLGDGVLQVKLPKAVGEGRRRVAIAKEGA